MIFLGMDFCAVRFGVDAAFLTTFAAIFFLGNFFLAVVDIALETTVFFFAVAILYPSCVKVLLDVILVSPAQ